MSPLAERYAGLRLAVIGDFCLDRYFEIDPARQERSIETGRPVHNVIRVRSQPGAAGTIVNNLVALGIGTIHAVGFAGDDGEGFELRRALAALPGLRLDHFLVTDERQTFTYGKPLVIHPNQPPEELDRLDSKNWTPTPEAVQATLVASIRFLIDQVDAFIVLDQVDVAETGVVTRKVRYAVSSMAQRRPNMPILADSRRGLSEFPPLNYKMNRAELQKLMDEKKDLDMRAIRAAAQQLAHRNGRTVFVTLSELGILGATPQGEVEHVPCLPLRGPIDIVGAGDAVTANLTAALASGANLARGPHPSERGGIDCYTPAGNDGDGGGGGDRENANETIK